MSLRTRLLLAAAYLLAVVVIALEVPLAKNIEQRAAREFESGLLSNAVLLAARINDDVPKAAKDPTTPVPDIVNIVGQTARELQRTSEVRFVVTDKAGRLLADSDGEEPNGTLFGTSARPEFASALSSPGGNISIITRYSSTLRQDLLIVAVPVVHRHDAIGVVRASEPTGALQARVHRIWLGLVGIGVAVIALGLLLAWLLATNLARPVRRLENAAVKLGAGDLTARAEPGGPKEVKTLAQSFNGMAGSLSANIAAQRDFLAHASHQLRTPLTGLKLRLEAIEGEGGFVAGQARRAQTEADRLNDLVEGLLALARASSVESTGTRVDLGDCARSAIDRWIGPATSAGKRLRVDVEGDQGGHVIWADVEDVGHVLDNLLENAIRYAPSGTPIDLAVRAEDDMVELSVHDDGPGIPVEDRPRVFDRFYRGAIGKRTGPGTGLGLAIVSEVVHRWGGTIELADEVATDQGAATGTTFRACFPVAHTLS